METVRTRVFLIPTSFLEVLLNDFSNVLDSRIPQIEVAILVPSVSYIGCHVMAEILLRSGIYLLLFFRLDDTYDRHTMLKHRFMTTEQTEHRSVQYNAALSLPSSWNCG